MPGLRPARDRLSDQGRRHRGPCLAAGRLCARPTMTCPPCSRRSSARSRSSGCWSAPMSLSAPRQHSNSPMSLGWIGMLTTLAGALMAVRQDDMKRMLAYSSMSQLGYIVTAIALMSHLGWVTALYLVANHLMVKGILFLAAAAIILRTGTRAFGDLGGLARAMPFTFAPRRRDCRDVRPAAACGVWRQMAAAERDDGEGLVWAGALGLLATFVGFLYMARFIQAIFLGAPKRSRTARLPKRRSAPGPAISADRRDSRGLVPPEASDRSGLRSDRPLFRLDAAAGTACRWR